MKINYQYVEKEKRKKKKKKNTFTYHILKETTQQICVHNFGEHFTKHV